MFGLIDFRAMGRLLFGDQSGNVAIIFGLALVPLLVSGGMALDYSRASNARAKLQHALDSAALAAAKGVDKTDAERTATAQAVFTSNFDLPCAASPAVQLNSDGVTASADCVVTTTMMGIAGFDLVSVSATATAQRASGGLPMCVFALDPSMQKALEGSGGTEWTANECAVRVNSSHAQAVNLSGGSSITSGMNCFVGGVQQGYDNIDPSPEPGCSPLTDPFASMTKPAVGACDYNDYSANSPTTLSPGVYCGGLELKNDAFTLSPGLYIIKDGEFKSSGGAQISGTGVTFFLTGNDIGVTWSGGGEYQFSAMTTGELAGFVIYLDPDGVPKNKSHISGGGDTFYEGVLYFPNQKLEISGGGSVTTPSPFTAFVANNFVFSGGSELLINADEDATNVPIPAGLYLGTGVPILIN